MKNFWLLFTAKVMDVVKLDAELGFFCPCRWRVESIPTSMCPKPKPSLAIRSLIENFVVFSTKPDVFDELWYVLCMKVVI